MLAMSGSLRLSRRALRLSMRLGVAVLADIAVAFDRPAAAHHHGAIFLLGHPGHAAGHLLEALSVGRADFGEEVDVAPKFDAAVEVTRHYSLLLLLAHRPFVQIGAFVGLEPCAVLR